MPQSSSAGEGEFAGVNNLWDLSLFDDFCSFFLVQKIIFPIEVSRINSISTNPYIQQARKTKETFLKNKILEIANSKGKRALEAGVKDLIQHLLQDELASLSKQQLKQALEYVSLYSTDCPIELTLTFRYQKNEGECCIVARSSIGKGTLISGLGGIFCPLPITAVERLKKENRDFSVMYSASLGTQGIFVGTARFLNHDCKPNCEFSLISRQQVKVKALREIAVGEELTVFYDKNYFGLFNKECLCESCSFSSSFEKCNKCTENALLTEDKRANLRIRKSFISPCSECKIIKDESRKKQQEALEKRNLDLFQKRWPFRR